MIMIQFDKDHLKSVVTEADMKDIGTVTLKEMRTLPFLGVYF